MVRYTKKRVPARRVKRPIKRRGKGTTIGRVKSIVKRAIARNTENKTSEVYNLGRTIYGSASSAMSTTMVPLSPYTGFLSIDQGVSQGQRIGNRIKIKNISIKGNIVPRAYNASTNSNPRPCVIILRVFYDKQNPTAIPNANASDFLQMGGSSQALTNDMVDMYAPLNADRYRLLTKRIYKIGFQSYETPTTSNRFGNTNNDFKLNINFKLNVTKYCIKNVRYNDNNTTPTTRGCFMVMQCVAADGTTVAAPEILAEYSYILKMDYEDA